MSACRVKRVSGIKMESVNSAKSTNAVEIIANGPYKDVSIQRKADTGAVHGYENEISGRIGLGRD